jgi:PAS domain S-box-containing protein
MSEKPSGQLISPLFPSGQTDRLFRTLIEAVTDYAIFMLDPTGRVATWNTGAQRLKGYAADEIIGEHFSRFYPQSAVERGWPQHELSVARAEGRFEDEGWRVRKDGSTFWANVIITAVRDEQGGLQGFGKITRDLTERRRQEDTLRHSEERFRLLVDGVQDYAIFMLDTDGRIMSWNSGAERIKGYTPQEIIGRHFSTFYPPELIAVDWPAHELRVARAEGRYEEEAWRVRKDGSRFWANVVISALRDPNGTLRGYAKVTRDLTQRKQVEALREAGRKTEEFIAMLGHELRNPLAPIRNAVQVMRMFRLGNPKLEWCRDVIDRQVDHMGRLVDDLLDVNRITTGKILVVKEPMLLSAALARGVESSMPLLNEHRHRLEVVTPDVPIRVDGDLTRLSQVFLNLLNNAAKYTPEGGVVRLSSSVEDGEAVVRVRDNGIGIAPELLPKIFDLFVQGSRSMDRADGGLGIGLSLVREILRLHGGTISADSAGTDHGSEFTVRLPLLSEITAEALVDDAAGASGPHRRILVVDDNRDAAASLALLLGNFGHEVHVAHDGEAALERARELRPDTVLLDIGLPGINGYEVAAELRQLEGVRNAMLIAITGYGQDDDRKRSSNAGFDHHLVKPVNPVVLNDLLAGVPR